MILWNFDLLRKNYGSMEKKLWHFGQKIWYNGQNYDTIPRTMELRFTKEKHMVDYPKLRNFDL